MREHAANDFCYCDDATRSKRWTRRARRAQHELVFIGSPETVAKKIHDAAQSGLFNTFMGEFNFSDLPERDLMRSIRLFGEKVIPALRGYEPF
jgi:alkanesulfonate monooxygenase SsuD/methylene tetrahydromethanopterin reductase-like flavin-dependent oxidoreductase (luciferase family)